MSSVSLDQILGELEKTESVTDNQIISGLLSKDNIKLKTEIPIPPSAQNASAYEYLVNKAIKSLFGNEASKSASSEFESSLEFAISHGRESRKEIERIFTKSSGRVSGEIKDARKDLIGQVWGR